MVYDELMIHGFIARSCIGQRFALMEEKIVLSHFFRHYNVKSLDQPDEIPRAPELVLRPKKPLRVQILSRAASRKPSLVQ